MCSILDIWQCYGFASGFGTSYSSHYFFHLVYGEKTKLLAFYFCGELKSISI